MPAKKKTAKKTARKTAAKKKTASKAAARKKAVAKKAVSKKAAVKKTAKKKAAAAKKKAPAKKKAVAKKAAGKKTAAAPAKKAATKKTAAKKAAAKKAATPEPAKKKAPPKPVKLTIFVKKQRQKLLDLRDELMEAMYGVQHDTLLHSPEGSEASGSGMHQGDAGSDAYDRDFALNLLSKEQDALHEIEAALERISDGIYGICEISGKKIPQARLEAIPFARLTVECQTEWEKEHPNQKFLGTQPVGFGGNGASAVSLDGEA